MKSFFTILVCSFLIISCGDMNKISKIADNAIVDFHNSYNLSDYDRILQTVDKTNFDDSTNKKFVDLMKVMNKKIGKETKSENIGWNIKTINAETQITIQSKSTFEKGIGVETFTYKIENDKPLLVGYYISSDDLILK